jgi:signal transduction histidine kinase
MMRSLLEFWRPVPNDRLGAFKVHLARTGRTLGLALAMVFPLGFLAGVATGATALVPTLLFVAVAVPIWLGAARIFTTPWGQRHPEWSVLLLALLLHGFIFVTPWLSPTRDMTHVEVVVVTPLFFSALCFWRPGYTVVVGALAIAVTVGAGALTTGELSPESINRANLGVVFTLIGMTANQALRRVWRDQWDDTRAWLIAGERMSQLGRMTSGIAHELKTPIAAADGALGTLRGLSAELGESIGHPDVTPDDLAEIAGEIGSAVALAARANRRASEFVASIRSATRGLSTVARVRFDLGEQTAGGLALLAHRVRRSGTRVDTDGMDEGLSLYGDPGRFEQILTNLIDNAVHATADVPDAVVRLRASRDGAGLHLEVEDDGPGVPEELRDSVFDYLFTTKGEGGNGLGLALCRDLVEGEFRGTIQLVERADGRPGARFVLMFRDAEDGTLTAPREAFRPAPKEPAQRAPAEGGASTPDPAGA